jgi:hypothetical protein
MYFEHDYLENLGPMVEAITNQHQLAHHPLDVCYCSIVDELQLS